MDNKQNSSKPIALALLAVAFVICVYAAYYGFLYFGYEAEVDTSGNLIGVRSGTFGDAFGALNALFSGFAFSGVIVTLLLQRKDLSDSQADISRQQVEAQFYNMLNLQQSVVAGFDLQRTKFQPISNTSIREVVQGRDCFKSWFDVMVNERKRNGDPSGQDSFEAAYRVLWSKHRGDLSIYFRSLYSLFKFVSKSEHVDKKWLSSVARSFISDYELVILFYNCLMPYGEKFQVYANEFSVFDNLDVELLFKDVDVTRMKLEAFGDNPEVKKIFQAAGLAV